MDSISLKEARAKALKYYSTGKACPRGHFGPRYVRSSACVECNRERRKRWAQKFPDKAIAWNIANPDRMRDINNRFYANNREKRKAHARDQRKNNIEYRREYAANYRRTNKQKILAHVRSRKALKKGAAGRHTGKDIREILRAQGGKCAYCRILLQKFHVDHITALVDGGSNARSNLQLTCKTCNLRKNRKHPNDFARQLGLLI